MGSRGWVGRGCKGGGCPGCGWGRGGGVPRGGCVGVVGSNG